jgi:hypothetical protein
LFSFSFSYFHLFRFHFSRLAIAFNLFSFLPENEKYELSHHHIHHHSSQHSVSSEPGAARLGLEVGVGGVIADDDSQLSARFLLRYSMEQQLLRINEERKRRREPKPQSVEEEEDWQQELVNNLVRFGFWNEAVAIRCAQGKHLLLSSSGNGTGGLTTTSLSSSSSTSSSSSVEELLLVFLCLLLDEEQADEQEQNENDKNNQNDGTRRTTTRTRRGELSFLSRNSAALSFGLEVSCSPPSFSEKETNPNSNLNTEKERDREAAVQWIVHLVSNYQPIEAKRGLFLSLWRYVSRRPRSPLSDKLFRLFADGFLRGSADWRVLNPLPFLLESGRVKETEQILIEILKSNKSGNPSHPFLSEFWFSRAVQVIGNDSQLAAALRQQQFSTFGFKK